MSNGIGKGGSDIGIMERFGCEPVDVAPVTPKAAGAAAPSAETLALAVEIERKRAERKAKLQGKTPTGEPVTRIFRGNVYRCGSAVWRPLYGNQRVELLGYVSALHPSATGVVILDKDPTTRIHFDNAPRFRWRTFGDGALPSWELARQALRKSVADDIERQRRAIAYQERCIAEIDALVDPTAPVGT